MIGDAALAGHDRPVIAGKQAETAQEDRAPAGMACPLACPVCGDKNAPEAVFCGNPSCGKALGDFRYVLEELRAEALWHHTLADRITAFMSGPHFVATHFIWFALWVLINTGLVTFIRKFDEYPFFLLVTILAIETIFITIFVLISNARQSAHADKRAELDYEVNVRSYREMQQIQATLDAILDRIHRLEGKGG